MYKLNLFTSAFELNPTHQDQAWYQARWFDPQVVDELHRNQGQRPLFLLHDGPPYANGSLHLGHFVNKSLKDALLKFKRLEGFYAPFVPGFDCHGLPVELEVEKQGHNKQDPKAFVQACRGYALAQTQRQTAEFASFGVHADWQAPYLTMAPEFEVGAARLFANLPQRSQRLRPVHWCAQCGSSLAEAEVEHRTKASPSVDVLFEVVSGATDGTDGAEPPRYLQVWTTTPYTLPANQAVGFHPRLRYVEVPSGQEGVPRTLVRVRREEDPSELADVALEGMLVRSPWSGALVPLLSADYVTSAGTGLVHLAPAFGVDDFRVCEQHRAAGVLGLEVSSWVSEQGCFEGAGQLPPHAHALAGMTMKEATACVMQTLRERGLVLRETSVQHEYPHCWRHKTPLFFRASAQWLLELDELSGQALSALEAVQFFPEGGRERLSSMLRTRQSWCVSRQRLWGTPLVASPEDEQALDAVAEHGLSAWHVGGPRQTLDVWFDSGVTHELVLQRRFGRAADVYLEGTDQHRGWFQSSLLTSVALRGRAPFKQVFTHGFVVDEHGKKYSKSSGNYVPLETLFKKHSPDVLRVWALSQDCTRDLKMSELSLKQAEQRLRRLRNTMRFCLQNLADFRPDEAAHQLDALQNAFLGQLHALKSAVRGHAERYEFAPLTASVTQFCESVSAEYFPAWKDTLYCEAPGSALRRQVQAVLWHLAQFLVRVLVPLAPFAAEDAAKELSALVGEGRDGRTTSPVLLTWAGCVLPEVVSPLPPEAFEELQALRGALHRRLEAHRDGRVDWEGLQGVKQLAQVNLGLDVAKMPPAWPRDAKGQALLAQYLGCAQVELVSLETPVQEPLTRSLVAKSASSWACACCRRHKPAGSLLSSLCDRCELVQGGEQERADGQPKQEALA